MIMIVVLLLSLLSSQCCAMQGSADITLEESLAQLDNAIDAYEEGEESSEILEAAAELAFVFERDGIESATGELTLGNAYFFGGDLGQSILHYRRGLAINPTNDELFQNLRHARSFVEPIVSEDGSDSGIWSLLMGWRGVIDRWTIWYGSLVLLGCASIILTLRIAGLSTGLQKMTIPLAVLGIIGIGMLAMESVYFNHDDSVVIVQDGYGLYAGPDAHVYLPVVEGMIGAGTEGTVLERRDRWCKVELGNGLSGWIESDTLEPVTW